MKPWLACLLLACASCADGPADVAGTYTLALVSGENGCAFSSWTVGSTSSADIAIAQEGGDVTGSVTGLTGTWLDIVLGGHDFIGTVSGDQLKMTLYGTTHATQGSCSYSVNAITTATARGDSLAGEIDYTTVTNGSPDCGALQGCHSVQSFGGARPPRTGDL